MLKDTIVFSLTTSNELTEKVCKKLKIKPGVVKMDRFADGEFLTKSETSVRGKDVFVIQSTSNPVNDSIMELLIFIDSLKRGSAEKITAIIPYYGYARQDRKAEGRQPITSKLIANLLEKAGVDKVVTFDLHAPQIQGFFEIPTDNLKGLAIIRQEIKKLKIKNLVIASPDYGGLTRARNFAKKINPNTPIATIDKVRHKKNTTKIENVFGDVNNKNVIIVDDMIDTGGSIIKAAEAFKKAGAKKVFIACTHPVFSKNAAQKIQNSKAIDKAFTTDTIQLKKEQKLSKIKVLSVSSFIADVIKANKKHTSISSIYEKYDK